MAILAIQKWGNSQGIRLPKSILSEVNWSDNEIIEAFVKNGEIILKKKEEPLTLQALFENFDEDTKCQEFDWGDDENRGAEVW
ncbi:MAG: AbrB/MazE/SpoVT family DNA-binding domain-containing protein [Lachnospirales bacterium]